MIIFRYLFKEIYSTLLVSALVVLLVLIASQFIHYLMDAASGNITFTTVIKLMSLQVPLLLGYLLPLSLFLGILLALSRLCVDRELIVMFACGISKAQLLRIILAISTLAVLVTAWLMLWEEPKIQYYRANILTHAMQKLTVSKIIPRRFQEQADSSSGGHWFFYVKSINQSSGKMRDVFFAHTAKQSNGTVQWDIATSNSAYETYRPAQKARFLVFQDGYRTIGTPGYNDYQVAKYHQYGVRLDRLKVAGNIFRHHVKYWSTAKLLPLIFKRPDVAAEFHWRLAMPISAVILAVIALSFSYTNPRLGRFAKFFPAVILYIIYGNLLFIGRDWIETQKINIIWGLWWVHIIFLVIAIILLGQYLGWWACLYRKLITKDTV